MLALDLNRLKHPALSVRQTALLQLALRLKANSTKARDTQRDRWAKRLRLFLDDCAVHEAAEPRAAAAAAGAELSANAARHVSFRADAATSVQSTDAVANKAAQTFDFLRKLSFADVRARYLS
jgi:hypothetical protein